MIVLPGGGYAEHAAHEGEPVARWLAGTGVDGERVPLPAERPAPGAAAGAARRDRRRRAEGARRVGLIGFSAGGHLAGLAALAPGAAPETVQFAVLGYAITSMETETYRPSRLILLGEDASPELRRSTSLDALVTPGVAAVLHLAHRGRPVRAARAHLPPRPRALAARGVPHTVHVFAHGPHSLGLAPARATRRSGPRWRTPGSMKPADTAGLIPRKDW